MTIGSVESSRGSDDAPNPDFQVCGGCSCVGDERVWGYTYLHTHTHMHIHARQHMQRLVECKMRVEKELGDALPAPLELSMGMSSDYEAAIRMGSTNVRVGRYSRQRGTSERLKHSAPHHPYQSTIFGNRS